MRKGRQESQRPGPSRQDPWKLHSRTMEAISKLTSPSALLATLIELKLGRKGVRLTSVEKKRLRAASDRYLETEDPSIFNYAIRSRRNIKVSLTARDVTRLGKSIEKAVESTVTEIGKRLARSLEPELRRWGHQQCEWQFHEYDGFKGRNARRWDKPFRLFARFRWAAGQVGDVSIAHLTREHLLNSNRLATAVLLLHSRAFLIGGEIEELMRAGYADAAIARWRTLHEVAVIAAFLVERGEETANRYLRHHACEEYRAALSYEKNRRKLRFRPLGKRYLRELAHEVTQLRAEYGDYFHKDYGWAAKDLGKRHVTFADIEEAVNLGFMRPYYKFASEQVHASPSGAVRRSGVIAREYRRADIVTGASNYGFADAGSNAAQSLLLVTVSLGLVALTVDANVILLVMTKWIAPLQKAFADVQRKIEIREAKKHAAVGVPRSGAEK